MPFPILSPKSLLVKPWGVFFPFLSFPTLKLFQAFSDGWSFCSWLILVETEESSVWAGLGPNWGGSYFSCSFRPSHVRESVAGFKPRCLLLALKSSMAFGTDYLCDIPKHPHRGGSPTRCHWGNATGTNCFHSSEFFPHGHSTNLEQVAPSPERRLFGPQVVNTALWTCSLLISFLLIISILLEMQLIAP